MQVGITAEVISDQVFSLVLPVLGRDGIGTRLRVRSGPRPWTGKTKRPARGRAGRERSRSYS